MANNSNSSGGGIGFVGLLTIVFITLKPTGFIALVPLFLLIYGGYYLFIKK